MTFKTKYFSVENSQNITSDVISHFSKGEEFTQEQKWEAIRKVRDSLLEQTDWIIGKNQELGISVPQNYLDYRQLLRNIPQTYQNPEDVIFPEL